MTDERKAQGMRSMARDMSGKRTWTRQNPYTTMISARVPNSLVERLRAYVDYTGDSISDVVVCGLDLYLKEHSPMDRAAGRKEDGDGE